MPESTFLLCPGQGAQSVGMGAAGRDAPPAAHAVFEEADDLLGFSLSGLCSDGPAEMLNRTDMAQVAIYTDSVAAYRGRASTGTLPEVTAAAGLSLGEFTALHLAGAFSFADGLRLVKLRGEAMQEAAEASGGTMVALTGEVEEEAIVRLCDACRGDGVLVPANFNSPMQVVASGSVDACARLAEAAGEAGYRATELSVAGAFHSPLMAPAAERLRAALDGVGWSPLTVPVYANVTAAPHEADAESIKARLVEQLTAPVRWTQSMQRAAADGHRDFLELPPGRVLGGLMRRIDRSLKVTPAA
ncbi:ACP S-malonyltransferase [Phycisphaera mikurensis]|uniref:Malonyl CoA-acyl carrier protein transacylase n=1 Tax=Phycisphaera mikurensis (strain NBRC 102666 / KCTC 22515 / FYK2301M01) TaxID=1142394 RepID=I0IF48_PHYMF|nr:ACP S-malonyltransferase [Phycisphaera mikurensis]MBB6440718.1 [acyl-carrier-protein] S-malonyltransferase [Phycisphaera mikurensis]BAM03886.1 malonyl CoA-acyl carrier protein transacylase [Phycisphaera mikurensis NBRC 102666]